MKNREIEIVLHVGHPKTGTTSIQKTLSVARPWLAERGFLYPELPVCLHNHRTLIPSIFAPKAVTSLGLRMGTTADEVREASLKNWQLVYQQITDVDPKTLILSAEGLLRTLSLAEAQAITERLEPVSKRPPRILAYVRSPSSYYVSRVQQMLKGGRGIAAPSAARRLEAIKTYEYFFPGCIDIRCFDRRTLRCGDVVADFVEWLGLPQLVESFAIGASNSSVSAEAMSVLHRLGPETRPTNKIELAQQRRLAKIVKQCDAETPGPTKPKLKEEPKKYVDALNSDFVTLREQYGLSFADYNYGIDACDPERFHVSATSVDDITSYDVERRDVLESAVVRRLRTVTRLHFLPRLLGRA